MWSKCSICKTEIQHKAPYYVCNVSTCNGKRTGLKFCSVNCWERHLPGARHKSASAVEEIAPPKSIEPDNNEVTPKRRIISNTPPQRDSNITTTSSGQMPQKEILIVASKLKNYIKFRSDMNTSQSVMSILSDIVRKECEKAMEKAKQEGRKTVLDRDFK